MPSEPPTPLSESKRLTGASFPPDASTFRRCQCHLVDHRAICQCHQSKIFFFFALPTHTSLPKYSLSFHFLFWRSHNTACPWEVACATVSRLTPTGTFSFNNLSPPTSRFWPHNMLATSSYLLFSLFQFSFSIPRGSSIGLYARRNAIPTLTNNDIRDVLMGFRYKTSSRGARINKWLHF